MSVSVLEQQARLERICKNVSYKPGCEFIVGIKGLNIELVVKHHEVSIANPQKGTVIYCFELLSPEFLESLTNEEIVSLAIRNVVLKFERHEIDEWLKYKGINVMDPHPEIEKVVNV